MHGSGRMRSYGTALLLTGMLGLQGCLSSAAMIVQAAAQVGTAYLTATRKPVTVITADCSGEIEPIFPSDGFLERMTEDELSQIDRQAVMLEELCGPPEDKTPPVAP